MSIRIVALQIADPESQNEIKLGIEKISDEFPGDSSVSVLDSPTNDGWEIKLTGPDGVRRVRMLSGPYQHSVQAVQRTLRELQYPSGKDKVDIAIAKLLE